MPGRSLYIVAYDISDATRLRRALNVLKGYATGGQKSVFECYLTDRERRSLLGEARELIDRECDRLMLIRLEQRVSVKTLGIAVKPADPEFYYVG